MMQRIGVGREAEVFALSDTECVKLFYAGHPLALIQSEAERLRFVSERGVPAPACYGLTRVDGRDGIRMERLRGDTMLRESLSHPLTSADIPDRLGTLQRAYHRVDASGLGDMTDTLIAQIGYGDWLSPAWKDELIRRLRGMPRDSKLVHMDYHADNVVMTPDGARIIDWSGACAGHPLADAARTLMTMELHNYPPDATPAMRQTIDDTRAFARSRFLLGYGAGEEALAPWKPFIAAARLFCCPEEERAGDLAIVRAALA